MHTYDVIVGAVCFFAVNDDGDGVVGVVSMPSELTLFRMQNIFFAIKL